MSRPASKDELPAAVVAAIIATLSQLAEPDEHEQPSAWKRSGQVAPAWRETGRGVWGRA